MYPTAAPPQRARQLLESPRFFGSLGGDSAARRAAMWKSHVRIAGLNQQPGAGYGSPSRGPGFRCIAWLHSGDRGTLRGDTRTRAQALRSRLGQGRFHDECGAPAFVADFARVLPHDPARDAQSEPSPALVQSDPMLKPRTPLLETSPGRAWLALLVALVAIQVSPAFAATSVYHSPNDDGLPGSTVPEGDAGGSSVQPARTSPPPCWRTTRVGRAFLRAGSGSCARSRSRSKTTPVLRAPSGVRFR